MEAAGGIPVAFLTFRSRDGNNHIKECKLRI